MSIFEALRKRNCIQDVSNWEALLALPKGTPFYWGVDPTAPSLQLGNFAGVIALAQLTAGGLSPVMLFGGATASIGDPSGRNSERQLLPLEVIAENVARQVSQTEAIFERLQLPKIKVVNNLDWTKHLSMLDFMRDIGKYLTVNYMLAKDAVKTRLDGDGISFTEFSYMLLQAMDFKHLYEKEAVRLQIGGSDQWGNMTAGVELIRKSLGKEALAFSFPLITDSQGRKFGKSTGHALWLDPKMTSPFQLHQFLLNCADSEVGNLLRRLTLLTEEEIQEIESTSTQSPEKRIGQRALADYLVSIVHGVDQVEKSNQSAKILFGADFGDITRKDLEEIFVDVPSSTFSSEHFQGKGILDLFVDTKLLESKGKAKQLLQSGALSINNRRLEGNEDLAQLRQEYEGLCVLRSGKKNFHVVKWLS